MKEKILQVAKEEFGLTTLAIEFFVDKLEPLINQEVEKRIKERIPSKEAIMREADLLYSKEIFIVACEWLLSCLTCSEKPNNSQKTEGGGE